MFIRYVLLLPLNLLVALIAVLLSPILPAFATSENILPKWLSWFQTPDATLDGDSGWQDVSKHPYVNKLPRYFRRMLWICRNPSYGFNWTVLASKPLPIGFEYSGRLDCSRSLKETSYVFIKCGDYFHYRLYLKYPFINYCFQVNIGWNMHEMCIRDTYVGQKAKYRFTPHPFKRM